MHHLLLWSIILGCFSASLYAQDLSNLAHPAEGSKVAAVKESKMVDSYVFNLGNHTEFYKNIQSDDSGGVRKFDVAPTIGMGARIPLSAEFQFLPEINWVLPRKAGSSKIMKNLFMFRADWGYTPIDWFRLRLGTSILWLNQHGSGGSANVNNGNGTATFYYPDENRSSFNNTLDLGVEGLISDNWSLRTQLYVYSIFKEERRQISYTLFISYYWDR
jgi:hypothetical protein